MRKRHIVALATLALVGGVMTYQAFTATPPEPFVRTAGLPSPPTITARCENGALVRSYTSHDGVVTELSRAPDAC